MTILGSKSLSGVILILLSWNAAAQTATSLKSVNNIYVGSLGSEDGSDELKRSLSAVLRHSHTFHLVAAPEQADIVLEGRGEMWIRSYHSLSPRARINPASAEPSYSGYLSIKARGKDGDILWSYLATPPAISIGDDLKKQLTSQVVNHLQDGLLHAVDDTSVNAIAASAPSTQPNVILQGAGATFPLPIYRDWFASFHARHPAWKFEYEPIGSEAGVQQLAKGTIDFAGSDIAPSATPQVQHQPAIRAFPSVGGAVALIYNLPRGEGLQLTAGVLADILLGKIKTWNDPALRLLNKGQSFPEVPIITVHRNEGSGTTFALTDYLSKLSDAWKQTVGSGPHVTWPVGVNQIGNDGVAKFVRATPYSLGYVEFTYAFYNHLNVASIKNAAGRFIEPGLNTISAAANTEAEVPGDNFSVSITNSPAPAAYPISTFSWLVFKDDLQTPKREALVNFLQWMLTSGQKQCSAQGYAPLPPRLLARELEAVRKLASLR